jgi:PiT family inorganic phosphate transporter
MAPVPPPVLLALALCFDLVCGFNDGGNLLGAFLAARSLSALGSALVLLAGAALGPRVVGTAVATTVVYAVVPLPRAGIAVAAAALVAALLTLLLAWWRGLPTSTSLALVGGLAGAGLAAGGPTAVAWSGVARLLAGMAAALAGGAAGGWLVWTALHRILRLVGEGAPTPLRLAQTAVGFLQGVAYGGNGLARSIGLLAFAADWGSAAGRAGLRAGHLGIPGWTVWAALGTFGVGLLAGGARVARTVGFGLFVLRAADALASQAGGGLAILVAGALGIPVSSTQTVTAALVAAGAARRRSLPRWTVVLDLGRAWAVTFPLSLALGWALGALARV